jgi:mitotic spindle assembly checkpoint protein MAD2
MSTEQQTRQSILLQGSSTDTVSEFFQCALSSVLYQRGVYPSENFEPIKKFGTTVMTVKDMALRVYLNDVMKYFTDWLKTGALQKAVLVILGASSGEVLERWSFDVCLTGKGKNDEQQGGVPVDEGTMVKEIQAIIRQITASVTFLPLLEETCSIDLLAYTDTDASVPGEWEESDAKLIPGGANVQLRSFKTSVHRVDALVSYKQQD